MRSAPSPPPPSRDAAGLLALAALLVCFANCAACERALLNDGGGGNVLPADRQLPAPYAVIPLARTHFGRYSITLHIGEPSPQPVALVVDTSSSTLLLFSKQDCSNKTACYEPRDDDAFGWCYPQQEVTCPYRGYCRSGRTSIKIDANRWASGEEEIVAVPAQGERFVVPQRLDHELLAELAKVEEARALDPKRGQGEPAAPRKRINQQQHKTPTLPQNEAKKEKNGTALALSAKHFLVCMSYYSPLHFHYSYNIGGFIGLGYGPDGGQGFLSLLPASAPRVFALDLNDDDPMPSQLQVGGFDSSKYESRVIWSERQAQAGLYHWFPVHKMSTCGVDILDGVTMALVNTDDRCLGLPSELFHRVMTWAGGACDKHDSCYFRGKDTTGVPALRLSVSVWGDEVIVPLSSLLVPTLNPNEWQFCIVNLDELQVVTVRRRPVISLGTEVLRHLFMVFDMELDRIGLVQKNASLYATNNAHAEKCPAVAECSDVEILDIKSNTCDDFPCSKYWLQEVDEDTGECQLNGIFKLVVTIVLGAFVTGEILLSFFTHKLHKRIMSDPTLDAYYEQKQLAMSKKQKRQRNPKSSDRGGDNGDQDRSAENDDYEYEDDDDDDFANEEEGEEMIRMLVLRKMKEREMEEEAKKKAKGKEKAKEGFPIDDGRQVEQTEEEETRDVDSEEDESPLRSNKSKSVANAEKQEQSANEERDEL